MVGEVILGLSLVTAVVLNAIFRYYRGFEPKLSHVEMYVFGLSFGSAPVLAYLFGSDNIFGIEEVGSVYLAGFLYMSGLYLAGRLSATVGASVGIRRTRAKTSILVEIKSAVNQIQPKVFIVFVGIVIFVRAYAISMGGGIAGINSSEVMVSWNYGMVILADVVKPLDILLGLVSFVWVFQKTNRVLALSVLVLLIIFAFLDGRRAMIYLVLIAFAASLIAFQHVKLRTLLIGTAAVVLVLVAVTPFYLSFRSALQSQVLSGSETSVLSATGQALDNAFAVDEVSRQERGTANLATRPLNIRNFLWEMIDGQERYAPLYGAGLIQAQLMALPRILRWDESLAQNPKMYLQGAFGLPLRDAANSQVATGVADWGLFGAFLMGIWTGLFLNFVVWISMRFVRTNPAIGLFLFVSALEVAIKFESGTGYELIILRNFLIFMSAAIILKKFFRLEKKKTHLAKQWKIPALQK